MNETFAQRTHKEMLDVLMDPESAGPDIHYFMIRGGSEKRNITVWESGLVGREYIKTYGHYHVSDFLETYTVLAGLGIILLQERKLDKSGVPINNEVNYVKAIFVKTGSVVKIPERAGHLAINIGDTWFVTSDDSPVNFEKAKEAAWPKHADYESVKNMHGFAYYVVKKDGKPVFVKNPNYKNVPEIITENA
jgi:oxalate decarboxylase/phosphoglucose isomerase-like protein (cupin superfamily)